MWELLPFIFETILSDYSKKCVKMSYFAVIQLPGGQEKVMDLLNEPPQQVSIISDVSGEPGLPNIKEFTLEDTQSALEKLANGKSFFENLEYEGHTVLGLSYQNSIEYYPLFEMVDMSGKFDFASNKKSGNTSYNSGIQAVKNMIQNGSDKHYRESQLTRLLREPFSGNCMTTLMMTCSSETTYGKETKSTLDFGNRFERRLRKDLNAYVEEFNDAPRTFAPDYFDEQVDIPLAVIPKELQIAPEMITPPFIGLFNPHEVVDDQIEVLEVIESVKNSFENIEELNKQLIDISHEQQEVSEKVEEISSDKIKLESDLKKKDKLIETIRKENEIKEAEMHNQIDSITQENDRLKEELQYKLESEEDGSHSNEYILKNKELEQKLQEMNDKYQVIELNYGVYRDKERSFEKALENEVQRIQEEHNEIIKDLNQRFNENMNILIAERDEMKLLHEKNRNEDVFNNQDLQKFQDKLDLLSHDKHKLERKVRALTDENDKLNIYLQEKQLELVHESGTDVDYNTEVNLQKKSVSLEKIAMIILGLVALCLVSFMMGTGQCSDNDRIFSLNPYINNLNISLSEELTCDLIATRYIATVRNDMNEIALINLQFSKDILKDVLKCDSDTTCSIINHYNQQHFQYLAQDCDVISDDKPILPTGENIVNHLEHTNEEKKEDVYIPKEKQRAPKDPSWLSAEVDYPESHFQLSCSTGIINNNHNHHRIVLYFDYESEADNFEYLAGEVCANVPPNDNSDTIEWGINKIYEVDGEKSWKYLKVGIIFLNLNQ
eukprot:TRINITY_DN7102_c0_g1_i1.p1 TRINITY_DN7102_c0_g1~~TRINITY_DN7102_c0_g1_i1.p1  ORF type:complete len:900 (+),score=201.02 TRINITY_DN7102_c0_g1_i1:364-2700(+)